MLIVQKISRKVKNDPVPQMKLLKIVMFANVSIPAKDLY